MKLISKVICFIIVIILIVSICFIMYKDKNNYKKVNMTSGNVEQTKDYKLYEFGISNNDICMKIDNMVNEVMSENADNLDFEYIDVTKNMSLSNIYNINAVPTFIIVDLQGNVKYRKTGTLTRNELIEFINKVLNQ